ncbi:ATP-binding cassette domain-containing protein [Curtobacterium sp. MCLR17_036]|uniref:ATP-binding cassette domain-containing protein n=1 Tax=Curtobacterium sp. MCLR17_036 TaxID=2175620 RepID=UPI000DA85AE6|nr:ATP-binding cassette domain-containing protein [Curtobacterium sp. MCLR17_036]WIE65448.1 ATP-binding cassette domain-containing protein [Curtobacterium sp. MCLR17_036]
MPVTLVGVGHTWSNGMVLFRQVDRTFVDGTVTAVVGPSGSGKSTFLAVLAGMLRPTAGSVDRPAGCRPLWVFQNPHGVARRRALDHVALPFLARGDDRRTADRRAVELLGRFGLDGRVHARFGELSGGEAQRLMLARGVASSPGLMLVDEPTAQLDRATATEVNRAIGALAASGTVVVVATHDDDTRAACDSVLDLGQHR